MNIVLIITPLGPLGVRCRRWFIRCSTPAGSELAPTPTPTPPRNTKPPRHNPRDRRMLTSYVFIFVPLGTRSPLPRIQITVGDRPGSQPIRYLSRSTVTPTSQAMRRVLSIRSSENQKNCISNRCRRMRRIRRTDPRTLHIPMR